MRKHLISSIAMVAFVLAASASAFAADMAVKAPPPAPAPVPTWTGFYAGIQFGGGWSDEAVNTNLGNDPVAVSLFSGATLGGPPIPSGFRVSQSGAVGGFEAGYNWQAGSNWLLGVETDFSGSGMSGMNSATAALEPGFGTQTLTAQQETDWFGTVRGRVGWLATPNLLVLGTGGFAYGRVSDSANWAASAPAAVGFADSLNGVGYACAAGPPLSPTTVCFAGNSSDVRTGWTAGGGLEWLLDQHWSAKIEYLFVDLGTQTVRVVGHTSQPPFIIQPLVTTPSSFNAVFHDSFNVVRVGLNYRF